jgi:glycine/D-amino acid oxidase-like deaminating enzyme
MGVFMFDVAVVGGGLFGKIFTAHARNLGASVITVSDDREHMGSRAAGCVMRPSWMSSMTTLQISDAFALLDVLYGLQTVDFYVPLAKFKTVRCYRVDPSSILGGLHEGRKVQQVTADGVVIAEGGWTVEAKAVVVAAGVWTNELCPWVEGLSGRWGWSHRGAPVDRPVIRPWAPYKQIVALNLDDGESWVGDGTALVERSANHIAEQKSFSRCHAVVGDIKRTMLGARPYCPTGGDPCHISREGKVWAVTGGAKNGTAAAAWAAEYLAREIL